MGQAQDEEFKFDGEEAGAGRAAPEADLLAAGVLVALAIVVMVASMMLPVPGDLRTAPGLLPFLTGASLALMALALGYSAWKRSSAGIKIDPDFSRNRTEDLRALALAAAVALYILALQVLAFQIHFSFAGIAFVFSAFEPVTIIALSAIMHVAWRGPLWATVSISLFWTLFLSLVFQKAFVIPLPGGF